MFFDVLRTFNAPTGFIAVYLTNYSANYSLRNSDFVTQFKYRTFGKHLLNSMLTCLRLRTLNGQKTCSCRLNGNSSLLVSSHWLNNGERGVRRRWNHVHTGMKRTKGGCKISSYGLAKNSFRTRRHWLANRYSKH